MPRKAVAICCLPPIRVLGISTADAHAHALLFAGVSASRLTLRLVLEQLVQRHLRENLEVHEWQEVGLHVLVLGDLGVVVDRELHVVEVAGRHGLVEIHDVVADPVLRDVPPGEPSAELALPGLLFLCHHFVVDWTG